jgi:glycosyltransferase involved in cell wall biosynthesis
MMSLACVLEHPTQYDPPLWACLTRRGRLRPVVYYAQPGPPADREIGRPVTWSPAGAHAFEIRPLHGVSLRRRLRADRPDAVLTAGWTRPLTWRTIAAARSLGLPVILPSDDTGGDPPRTGLRRLVADFRRGLLRRTVDGYFTTGGLGRVALEREGAPPDRTAIGLYPVEVDRWQRALQASSEERKRLRLAFRDGSFVVLAVAKLSDREDPLLVIDALSHLRKIEPKAVLRFVGDGPLRPDVEARIAALSLQEAVRLEGYVAYERLAAYYGAADVFVHVPRREPWGLSIGEALACGVPVVAAPNVGAAVDLVEEGESGEIASSRDAPAVAAALGRVAAAWPRLDRFRAAALASARRADVSAAAMSLETLVERIREGRRG